MKKLLSLLLVMLLIVGTFAACNNTPATSSTPSSSEESLVEEPIESIEEPSSSVEEIPYEAPEDEDPWGEEDDIISDLSPEEQKMENILLGEDEQLNIDALYNEGNLARLAQVMKKSQKGETVKIIFYGNSANTALNTDETMADTPYSTLVGTWWNQNIGPCEVKRAGMDNLTSVQACLRIEQDVLQYDPDLVFLDFAVQDGIPAAEGTNNSVGFDNLIRLLLHADKKPAVVALMLTGAEQAGYTMSINKADMFASNAAKQKLIAKYYNIPIIDFETALWDNMIKLVKVTPQTEVPLMTWGDICYDNVIMNNDGHVVLFGTIKYYLNKVLDKLSTVSTKAYSYPTRGYFDNDTYMNGKFINMEQLYDIGVEGYKFSMDPDRFSRTGYGYRPAVDNDSRYPLITTHRPTEFLELTIPKVLSGERCYFMVQNPWQAANGGSSPDAEVRAYTPYRFDCYDENGILIRSVKPSGGAYAECYHMGKTNSALIPINTTRIVIKCYTGSGYVRLLGIGYFDKQ